MLAMEVIPEKKLKSDSTAEANMESDKKETSPPQIMRSPRPFINFQGEIKYCTDFIECAISCDQLLNSVIDSSDNFLVLGFDMEWPFTFATGSGKTALIQICPNSEICYVMQLLPALLTGVNINNDIIKLTKDFAGFKAEKILGNCIDAGDLANSILPFQQLWSMLKLVGFLMKMNINKDRKIRMSKWDISPLTKEQLKYAATDAFASLMIYNNLIKRKEASASKCVTLANDCDGL